MWTYRAYIRTQHSRDLMINGATAFQKRAYTVTFYGSGLVNVTIIMPECHEDVQKNERNPFFIGMFGASDDILDNLV